MRVGNAVLRLNHRVIDLRNANEEDAVSTVHHEQSLVAERIRKPCARCEIVRLEPNFSRGWEQWIRYQSCRGECCRSQRTPRLSASRLVTRIVSCANAAYSFVSEW